MSSMSMSEIEIENALTKEFYQAYVYCIIHENTNYGRLLKMIEKLKKRIEDANININIYGITCADAYLKCMHAEFIEYNLINLRIYCTKFFGSELKYQDIIDGKYVNYYTEELYNDIKSVNESYDLEEKNITSLELTNESIDKYIRIVIHKLLYKYFPQLSDKINNIYKSYKIIIDHTTENNLTKVVNIIKRNRESTENVEEIAEFMTTSIRLEVKHKIVQNVAVSLVDAYLAALDKIHGECEDSDDEKDNDEDKDEDMQDSKEKIDVQKETNSDNVL